MSGLVLMSVVFDLKSNRGDEVVCDFGSKRQPINTSQHSLERSVAGMAGQSGLSGLDQLLPPVAHGVVRRKSGSGAIMNSPRNARGSRAQGAPVITEQLRCVFLVSFKSLRIRELLRTYLFAVE